MKSIIRSLSITAFFLLCLQYEIRAAEVPQWGKFEYSFTSKREYSNVLYDVKKMSVRFVSHAGRVKNINAFWYGGSTWKIRFSPDEQGEWKWESFCSDSLNTGLHKLQGQFTCNSNPSQLDIYSKGSVIRP